MESALYGDLVRINTATDMMCEHYMDIMESTDDYEVMEEATSSVFKTIGTMITSAFERLKKFIKEKVEYIRRSSQMKKLKGTISAADKKTLKDIPADAKFEVVDLDMAYKYMDQIDKVIDEMVKRVGDESRKMQKFNKAELDRVRKLNKFVKSTAKRVDELYEKLIDSTKHTKKVSYSEYLKNLRETQEITTRLIDMEKRLDQMGGYLRNGYLAAERAAERRERELQQLRWEKTVNRSTQAYSNYKRMHESTEGETPVGSSDVETKKSVLGGLKSVFQSTIGAVARFTHKHAKAIYVILSAFSVYNAANTGYHITGAVKFNKNKYNRANDVKNTANAIKLDDEFADELYDMSLNSSKEFSKKHLKQGAKSALKSVAAASVANSVLDFGNKPLPEKYQKKK